MYKNVDAKMLIQRTVQNNVQFVFGYRNLGPPLVTHNECIYWTHILYAYFDIENSKKVKKTPLLPSHGDQVMLCDILTCGSWLCWNVHLIWHCPIKCSFWAFVCFHMDAYDMFLWHWQVPTLLTCTRMCPMILVSPHCCLSTHLCGKVQRMQNEECTCHLVRNL